MYYPDLTPYAYFKSDARSGMLNVGWLDEGHDFPTGDVPGALVDRLLALVRAPVALTRGFHPCPFCWGVDERGGEIATGNGEIHIPGAGGVVIVAPTLVAHYVSAHRYKPPASFVAAVLASAG